MEKKKKYNLSLIRFLAMNMIIFCHIFEWIGYDLSNSKTIGIVGNFLAVGVQIFLLLSGYLYGKRDDLFEKDGKIKFVLNNFKKILFDYYIYAFIVIFPIYCLSSEISGITILKNIFRLLTFSGFGFGFRHLWFIQYILFCYVLTPFFYDLKVYLKNNIKSKYILVCICGIALLEIFSCAYNPYFNTKFINCYIIGFFIFPYLKDLIKNNNLNLVISQLGMLVIFTIFWYILRFSIMPNTHSVYLSYIIGYGISYSCIFQAVSLFGLYSILGGGWLIKKY